MSSLSSLGSIALVLFITSCGAAGTRGTTPAAPRASRAHGATPEGVERDSIDPGTDPCDDFFQHACGGWIAANPIPDDQAQWTRFEALAEQNQRALAAILERDAAAPDASHARAKELGDFYASCMNEDSVERAGLSPLAPALERIDAVADLAGLARAVARSQALGARAFFRLSSEQDPTDATRVIARIEPRGMRLPDRDYYLKDDPAMAEMRGKYQAHVERLLGLVGEAPALARTHAESVTRVERALAEASLPKENTRDPALAHHKVDRAGLQKLAPHVAWDAFLTELGVPGVAVIDVTEPGFVTVVDHLFAAAADPSRRGGMNDLRAYLRAHLVERHATFLPARFVSEAFRFDRDLTGTAKDVPRWKRCVLAVDERMGMALGQPFARELLGGPGRQEAQAMATQIERSMRDDIARLTWMDGETRARALAKALAIVNVVGYPDEARSYAGLAIDRGPFAGNMMRAATFETSRDLAKIGRPVDRNDWEETPATADAYYDATLNQMVFPAGLLQPPFFWARRPRAVDYGAIGMVMGHELTHGFDDEGRKFDGQGNVRDWWTARASAGFEERAACLVRQFDGYVAAPGLHVNGKLTLGENIADLGGIRLAHAALVRARAPREDAAEADRQFFLGYAQAFCGSVREELKRVRAYDEHPLPNVRVNGVVSNLPEFAAAFACGAGAPMVRSDAARCEVW